MSSNPIHIVRATTEYLDLTAELFDGYRAFYGQERAPQKGRRFLEERLRREESVLFLAVNDDVGLGFTQLYPSFSSVSLKRLWILNDLFVAPAARRMGVGRALLERARRHALETEAKGLVLSTEVDNEPAQRLYEEMGWTRDEDFYQYYLYV